MPADLPPLSVLQGLFHYNPTSGAITRLHSAGRARAGDSAVHIRGATPYVFAHGYRHRATDIAWYLHHQQSPRPLYAGTANADPCDLSAANLTLLPAPQSQPLGRQPGARRIGHYRNRYIRRAALDGTMNSNIRWVVRIPMDGWSFKLGSFDSIVEARAARDAYLNSEIRHS